MSSDSYSDWQRHRGCERKRPYHCQLDANQAVLAAAERGERLSTYTCDFCGLIHLTSATKEAA